MFEFLKVTKAEKKAKTLANSVHIGDRNVSVYFNESYMQLTNIQWRLYSDVYVVRKASKR